MKELSAQGGGKSNMPEVIVVEEPEATATATAKVHDLDPRVNVIANYMTIILSSLGLDINDPSISETPKRVAKMLLSFNEKFDPATLLKCFETNDSHDVGGVVAQTNIPFSMLCEHHLLPAVGIAHVAYLPNKGRVVGLSKLSRLVKAVGKERPTLQEAIGQRIADLMSEHLQAKGVMVMISAEHTCMTCRGAHAPGVRTISSVVKGIFRDVPHARQEVIEMWKLGGAI